MSKESAQNQCRELVLLPSPLFAIPLNMSTGSWIVTIVASLGFVVMFGISSAGGDYKDLINRTLENDALTREKRKEKTRGKSLRQKN